MTLQQLHNQRGFYFLQNDRCWRKKLFYFNQLIMKIDIFYFWPVVPLCNLHISCFFRYSIRKQEIDIFYVWGVKYIKIHAIIPYLCHSGHVISMSAFPSGYCTVVESYLCKTNKLLWGFSCGLIIVKLRINWTTWKTWTARQDFSNSSNLLLFHIQEGL